MAPPLSGSSPLCSRPSKPTQLPPRSVSVWSRPPRLSATAKPGSTPRVATPLTVGLTSYLALAPPLSGYSPTSLPALPRLAPAHRGFSPSWPETQRAAGARLAHVLASLPGPSRKRRPSRVVLTQSCLSRLGRGGKEATARLLRLENLARPHGTFFCFDGFGIFPRSQGSGSARAHARAVHSGARPERAPAA